MQDFLNYKEFIQNNYNRRAIPIARERNRKLLDRFFSKKAIEIWYRSAKKNFTLWPTLKPNHWTTRNKEGISRVVNGL